MKKKSITSLSLIFSLHLLTLQPINAYVLFCAFVIRLCPLKQLLWIGLKEFIKSDPMGSDNH